MLHLIRAKDGRIKDARDGVALTEDQLKREFNPCGSRYPGEMRGDDKVLGCSVPGNSHSGPHKVVGFGNRRYEWSNEDAS